MIMEFGDRLVGVSIVRDHGVMRVPWMDFALVIFGKRRVDN